MRIPLFIITALLVFSALDAKYWRRLPGKRRFSRSKPAVTVALLPEVVSMLKAEKTHD